MQTCQGLQSQSLRRVSSNRKMPKKRNNFLKYRSIWTKIWIGGGNPGVFKRNRRSTWKYKRQWEVILSCVWGAAISPPNKFLTSAWENVDSGFLNKQVWTKMGDERQTGCWIVIIMGHSLMKILFRIVLSNIYQLCTIQVRWLPKGYTSTFNCLHSTFGEQFGWQSSNVESSKYFLFLQESLDRPSLPQLLHKDKTPAT